ncbi:MAG: DUF3256 family protein [Bacteroidales bacterium]|nr:DUF3256 family protein [Bacteroidales bacterium]
MLRFVSLYILILCSALPLRAGLIDSLFINALQDVLPLLGQTERLDLLDLYDYRLKAEVENRLGGRSLLEYKDSCMLRLRVSDAESWEMHCVQGEGGALLICLNSVRAGGEMTRLSAYNLSWQPIKLAFPKPDCKHFLTAAPADSLTDADLSTLHALLPALPVAASWQEGNRLQLRIDASALATDLRRAARLCLRPLTYEYRKGAFVLQ